jgi:hypothetical protein
MFTTYFTTDTVPILLQVTASVAECSSRNVHGRSRDDIAIMAQEWEETPIYISRYSGY